MISADSILKYFSNLSQTICMKCQGLFSGKKIKTVINLSSAEFAKGVITVNGLISTIFMLPEGRMYSCHFVRPSLHHTFVRSISLKVLKVI